jgi:integrase/recombinase XerD
VTAADRLSPDFPTLVRDFFGQRLLAQRNASPQTIAAYRDTFRLLLRFLQKEGRADLAALTLSDLDAPMVMAFLDHLERDRHNAIRTRNARLVALRSFFRYAAGRDPANLPTTQRVLAIPQKRCDTPLLGFLTREEIDAILAAIDLTTWCGRRDQALLATLYNTGARVSEAIGLRVADLAGAGAREATLHLRGKGRKERLVPVWRSTARVLAAWVTSNSLGPEAPLFPNRGGTRMTRSGVEQRLRLAVDRAATACPSLRRKRISPHTLRHTTAMHLLQSGVSITVIALWLGHEDPTTTHRYVEADLSMKRRALATLTEPSPRTPRVPPSEALLAFLEAL